MLAFLFALILGVMRIFDDNYVVTGNFIFLIQSYDMAPQQLLKCLIKAPIKLGHNFYVLM